MHHSAQNICLNEIRQMRCYRTVSCVIPRYTFFFWLIAFASRWYSQRSPTDVHSRTGMMTERFLWA
jgi:hypothetical protein